MISKARKLNFDGTRNTRDFGGMLTADGRRIKSHRLIRSEYLHRISDRDKADFYAYGLRHVIDLRGKGEIKGFPDVRIDGVLYHEWPLSVEPELVNEQHYPHRQYHLEDKDLYSLLEFMFTRDSNADADRIQCNTYTNMPLSSWCIQSWKNIFELCLKEKDGAILFHCTDGKDRTGLTAVLLLSALGVDEESILADYLATNDTFKERRQQRDVYLHKDTDLEEDLIQSVLKVTGVSKVWYDAFMQSIKIHYGSVLGFLTGPIGLTEKDIQNLKDNYLE